MRPETASSPALIPEPWRVVRVTDDGPGVRTLALAPVAGAVAPFRPGQFDMLYAFGAGEAAISISGDPCDRAGPRLHTIRAAGAVTSALVRLEAGATVGVRGPFGTGWPLSAQAGRHLLLIGGGLGLAPLRPVVLAALAGRPGLAGVTLVAGARSPEGLLYAAETGGWAARGVRLLVTVDRGDAAWTGRVGSVLPLLPEALEGVAPDTVSAFVCGPEVMMRLAAAALETAGVPRDRIWLSLERNMHCAIGHCGRCQFGPDFVCRDGPVLRWDRIAGRLAVEAL
jgi:NAD(P)H-flavin reductase